MLSSTSTKQYDAKKFPLCCPWDGTRGRSFYDEFMPDFISSLGLKGDDYANQQEHLTGNVPGGVPSTTGPQLLANNLHVNAELAHDGQAHDQRKSKANFKNRDAAIIAFFYNHIPNQSYGVPYSFFDVAPPHNEPCARRPLRMLPWST